jgi:hypothetical protein
MGSKKEKSRATRKEEEKERKEGSERRRRRENVKEEIALSCHWTASCDSLIGVDSHAKKF